MEQLEDPSRHDVFDYGDRRGVYVDDGVLVPGGGQPVGGDRDGHRTTRDETKVAGSRLCHHSGIGAPGELLEHDAGVSAGDWQWSAERCEQLRGPAQAADVAVRHALEKLRGQAMPESQDVGRKHARLYRQGPLGRS